MLKMGERRSVIVTAPFWRQMIRNPTGNSQTPQFPLITLARGHIRMGSFGYFPSEDGLSGPRTNRTLPCHPGLDPGSRFFDVRAMQSAHQGGWVYIMADRYRGTMYVGVTSDLASRILQHRSGTGSDFCAKYQLHRLVWAEHGGDIVSCIEQEKRVKRWRREWKFDLIERGNPEWRDLFNILI